MSAKALETQRVMIVDDEPQVVCALSDILEDEFEIVPETSPVEALEVLQDAPPVAAILCDMRMPVMTGNEFFRQALNLSNATRVLITGFADLEDVIHAINDGHIYSYLTKPWDEEKLKAVVQNAVQFHELQAELERERAMFDNLMHSVTDGVFIKDARGAFTRINEVEADYLGLAPDAVTGRRIEDLVPPGNVADWQNGEDEILSGAAPSRRVSRTVVSDDGTVREIDVALSGVTAADGAVDGVIGISRDVTEAVRFQRMKDEFVATVSHELRTPVTSIQGSLSMLKAGAVGSLPSTATPLVEIAHDNCGRLVRLVNDLLDMSKMDSSELDLELETVFVADLLAEAAASNAGYGQRDGKTIEVAAPVPDVQVEVDKARVHQVLSNLTSNALKFSQEGGAVRYRAKRIGEFLRISVVDLAGGVPKEFEAQMFDRFTQADGSDARRVGGTGLGLNISKSIVELHGGRMGYWTKRGLGSVFWAEFPIG